MRFIIIICLALSTLCCHAQGSFLSPDKFTTIYRDSLKNRFPESEFKIDSSLSITGNLGDGNLNFYLNNAYSEYKLDPKFPGEIISKHITSVSKLLKQMNNLSVNSIYPVIKPASYIDELPTLMKTSKEEIESMLVYEKYNDQLTIFYVKDTETSIGYLSKEDVKKLNLYQDDLYKIATDNLRSLLLGTQLLEMSNMKAYGIAAGGTYEASFILLEEFWNQENMPVEGDYIIGIPNRDLVFITGSNNKSEIKKLREVVANSFANYSYPVSPYLFKWNGKKFVKF